MEPRTQMQVRNLPDDLLIAIFQYCTIHDVVAIRLTCQHFRMILSSYERTIYLAVAEQMFPESQHFQLYYSLQMFEPGKLPWLSNLIPQYLAAALLEGPSFRLLGSLGWNAIDSEKSVSELRYALVRGWKVLKRLSIISQGVYSPAVVGLTNSSNASTIMSINNSLQRRLAVNNDQGPGDLKLVALREDVVLKRRMDYVESMGLDHAIGYTLLIRLLAKCLRYHPRFDEDGESIMSKLPTAWGLRNECRYDVPGRFENDGWGRKLHVDGPGPIEDSILWFIMHVGPDVFFKQWTSSYCRHWQGRRTSNPDLVGNLAWSILGGASDQVIKRRRQAASQVDITIRKRCLRPGIGTSPTKRTSIVPKGLGIEQALKHGTMDHKLLMQEAQLLYHFNLARQAGVMDNGLYFNDELSSEEQSALVHEGRHPREKVPFFVYLGRQPA